MVSMFVIRFKTIVRGVGSRRNLEQFLVSELSAFSDPKKWKFGILLAALTRRHRCVNDQRREDNRNNQRMEFGRRRTPTASANRSTRTPGDMQTAGPADKSVSQGCNNAANQAVTTRTIQHSGYTRRARAGGTGERSCSCRGMLTHTVRNTCDNKPAK